MADALTPGQTAARVQNALLFGAFFAGVITAGSVLPWASTHNDLRRLVESSE